MSTHTNTSSTEATAVIDAAYNDYRAAAANYRSAAASASAAAASAALDASAASFDRGHSLAAADEATMNKVTDAKLLSGTPTLFAANSLEIIVRKGNPSKIASLSDLSKSGLIYVTCAPEVPIGKYSAQVLQKAGVTITPASFEPDVKGIVAKVSAGEADAGIVYSTDIRATKRAADGVAIPANLNVIAKYPIAAIFKSGNNTAAEAWIAFVTGTAGQSILKSYGFTSP